MSATARRTERFEQIALAYIRALAGRWPEQTHLGEALRAISEVVPGVTASELRETVEWTLRESRREGAKLAAALRRGSR